MLLWGREQYFPLARTIAQWRLRWGGHVSRLPPDKDRMRLQTAHRRLGSFTGSPTYPVYTCTSSIKTANWTSPRPKPKLSRPTALGGGTSCPKTFQRPRGMSITQVSLRNCHPHDSCQPGRTFAYLKPFYQNARFRTRCHVHNCLVLPPLLANPKRCDFF